MKIDRQGRVLEILSNGKYRVDHLEGKLYSLIKGAWAERVPTKLADGKLQYLISSGVVPPMTVYAHDLVWLARMGTYPPTKRIVPKDGDWSNVSIRNLQIIPRKTS
jgi:hypothetical protein